MILSEGRNCWRVARADRAAYLVDCADYFAAFRQAVLAARRSVLILGWDIDSRTRLVSGAEQPDDGAPAELLPFLNHVLGQRRDLRVHLLCWDYYMIYAFEREPLPAYRFAWKAHPRLTFRLDGHHPVGASHHQKIVVVDDRVAFAGGLDLTIRRWDRRAHDAHDPGRTDPAGVPYPPMHDVQMVVGGDAARALGDLARARWRAATGRTLAAPRPEDSDPWPASVTPELRDVPIGIARTLPSVKGTVDVREVEALNLDAIAAARSWIYIENQYLTSASVGEALARRLAEPHGPEVVAVLPREECGWLERSSMGVMRARLLGRLRDADRFGRLRLLYPTVPGLSAGCLNVHAKVMIVDDTLARVGSSNLSNRSMGLDTECDLAIDAGADARLHAHVAGLRDRLLAEHLGAAPQAVAEALATRGSLIAAIDSLRGGPRSLEPLPEAPPTEVAATPGGEAASTAAAMAAAPMNLAIFDGLMCDPERPAPDRIFDELVPTEARHPARRSLLGWGLALGAAVALALIWRLTPLRSLLDVDRMAAVGEALRHHPAAPLLVLVGYLGGALVLFPITLMLAATALVFDPVRGLAYSLGGALAGAAMTYGIGVLLARFRGGWLSGPRLQRARRQLQRRGILAVVAARLLPIGNFSIINMVAGAAGIRFRDFMIGNALGLLPGILGLTLFADRLGSTVRNPQPHNILLLGAVVLLMVGLFSWLRRRLARAARRSSHG